MEPVAFSPIAKSYETTEKENTMTQTGSDKNAIRPFPHLNVPERRTLPTCAGASTQPSGPSGNWTWCVTRSTACDNTEARQVLGDGI